MVNVTKTMNDNGAAVVLQSTYYVDMKFAQNLYLSCAEVPLTNQVSMHAKRLSHIWSESQSEAIVQKRRAVCGLGHRPQCQHCNHSILCESHIQRKWHEIKININQRSGRQYYVCFLHRSHPMQQFMRLFQLQSVLRCDTLWSSR